MRQIGVTFLEAAEILGISPSNLYKKNGKGLLPTFKDSEGHLRLYKRDLQYIRVQQVGQNRIKVTLHFPEKVSEKKSEDQSEEWAQENQNLPENSQEEVIDNLRVLRGISRGEVIDNLQDLPEISQEEVIQEKSPIAITVDIDEEKILDHIVGKLEGNLADRVTERLCSFVEKLVEEKIQGIREELIERHKKALEAFG